MAKARHSSRAAGGPPNVKDVTGPLEVGREYLVPVLQVTLYGVMPIVPLIHDDSELGQNHTHVHYDYRFLKPVQRARLAASGSGIPVALCPLDAPFGLERMTCVRSLNTTDPCESVGRTLFLPRIHDACKGKRFNGSTCPHKGYRLEGVPPDEDGVVTCPLHGARWARDGSYAGKATAPEELFLRYIGSGRSGSGYRKAQVRLFTNDAEIHPDLTLAELDDPGGYEAAWMRFEIGSEARPRLVMKDMAVTIFIPEAMTVYGYYLRARRWDRPIWMERFRSGCAYRPLGIPSGGSINITFQF